MSETIFFRHLNKHLWVYCERYGLLLSALHGEIREWISDNEGKLFNTSYRYKNDTSTFKIDGDVLRIESWIARNQLYETYIYRLGK